MSAFTSICDYGHSDSEESDSDLNTSNGVRVKLPVPNFFKVPSVIGEVHHDDPQLHGGRIRSFSHVRGNWATFVYVKYDAEDTLLNLIEKLKEIVSTQVDTCELCDFFHISLSRTFVLKYHLISPFRSSLQSALSKVESFDVGFAAIKIYCNEECTRTFISLEVDPFSEKFLLQISKKVDLVLEEFQLPTFYKNPSFHMSILWVNGNRKGEITRIFEDMSSSLLSDINKLPTAVTIKSLNCKSGNKYYQYTLQ